MTPFLWRILPLIVLGTALTGAILIGLLVLLVSVLGRDGAALAVIAFVLLSNLVLYRSTVRYTGLRLMPFVRAPAGA